MAYHTASIHWLRNDSDFTNNEYHRKHYISFDGGHILPASSSPQVVKTPYSDVSAVDPEEMLVAALSSCHMLWFLSLAAKQGWIVNEYQDTAKGNMIKNTQGKLYLSNVTLSPCVTFKTGFAPNAENFDALHHLAHEECFIANSVLTKIRIQASMVIST